MNVEIGTKAAQFIEKEYINGMFVAVQIRVNNYVTYSCCFSTDVVTDQNYCTN
jgi:hypothetical protein